MPDTPLRQLQSGSLEETWQWIEASTESTGKSMSLPHLTLTSTPHTHIVLPPIATVPVYVVCHRGNDSQLAVKLLREYGGARVGRREGGGGEEESEGVKGEGGMVVIRDIAGGLSEWADSVDPHFPKY